VISPSAGSVGWMICSAVALIGDLESVAFCSHSWNLKSYLGASRSSRYCWGSSRKLHHITFVGVTPFSLFPPAFTGPSSMDESLEREPKAKDCFSTWCCICLRHRKIGKKK
jgi:hypothetical protein